MAEGARLLPAAGRLLVWLVRLALFLVLLGLAVRNAEPVTLRLFLDFDWQAPLALVLLAMFAIGALAGIAATFGTVLSQRRELLVLRRELLARGEAAASPAQPPAAEG